MSQNAGNLEFCMKKSKKLKKFFSTDGLKTIVLLCRIQDPSTFGYFEGKKNVEFSRLFHAEFKISSILGHFRVKKKVFEIFRVIRGFLSAHIFCHEKVYLQIREKR